MDDKTPDAISNDDASARTPRFITHDHMRQIERSVAGPLPSLRERSFLRHDGSWWVRDREGYYEIPDRRQNVKLDLWLARLSNGALWA